ncbi:sigma factor-like helix-turn-helix DNA-binding protein [Fervidicella metallireducens]|uniref:sigma factor-like helix-turn-helix DNA-binding protein n=1 Tax=Fervidicella metallireducens TaxID=655338 RepID=UPI000A00E11F
MILEQIYLNNISQIELAKRFNVSKQAINKIKKNALNNLRKIILKEHSCNEII